MYACVCNDHKETLITSIYKIPNKEIINNNKTQSQVSSVNEKRKQSREVNLR